MKSSEDIFIETKFKLLENPYINLKKDISNLINEKIDLNFAI